MVERGFVGDDYLVSSVVWRYQHRRGQQTTIVMWNQNFCVVLVDTVLGLDSEDKKNSDAFNEGMELTCHKHMDLPLLDNNGVLLC